MNAKHIVYLKFQKCILFSHPPSQSCSQPHFFPFILPNSNQKTLHQPLLHAVSASQTSLPWYSIPVVMPWPVALIPWDASSMLARVQPDCLLGCALATGPSLAHVNCLITIFWINRYKVEGAYLPPNIRQTSKTFNSVPFSPGVCK